MKKIILFSLIIVTALASCKKLNNPQRRDRLKSILFGKDTLTMNVGETRQVPITINPSDYHLDSLRWKSSDTTILSFSNTGLLTAKKVGTSTISVSNITSTITISALVTVKPAPLDSLKIGVIAYYPFDNSAVDSSGNGNNGTAFNIITATDRFGNENGAYHFKGDSSSYVIVKDNVALRLNNTDFTVNVWANVSAYSNDLGGHILSKRYPGISNGYTYSINGYGAINYPLGSLGFGAGGNDPGAYSTKGIELNNWHMLTLVYSLAKTQVTYYIDGVYVNSVVNIPSPNANTASPLYIGKDNPLLYTDYFLNASLDELKIYGRQLSRHEISVLYTRK